jgi:hypothetical protein
VNQLLITIESGIPTCVEGVLGHELQFVLANCLSMMHKPLHEYKEIFLCTMTYWSLNLTGMVLQEVDITKSSTS